MSYPAKLVSIPARAHTFRCVAALTGLLCLAGCSTGSLAPSLQLSKSALSFPSTYVGSPSASLSFTVTNSSVSTVSLQGISATTTGTATGTTSDFSELDNCPSSLGPQAGCTIWIVFTPTASGTRSGDVAVANSGGVPASASLNGLGVANPPATYSAALNQSSAFMGASIVQYWPMPDNDYGVSGQISSQMLARFQGQILGKGYTRVIILGGSNDILDGVTGVPDELVSNIEAMGKMASSSGMEVVLSLLPPSTWVPSTGIPFNTTVVQVNALIQQTAIENGWLVVDYYTPMAGHPEYFNDGLHPNATGYAVMEKALAGVVSR